MIKIHYIHLREGHNETHRYVLIKNLKYTNRVFQKYEEGKVSVSGEF